MPIRKILLHAVSCAAALAAGAKELDAADLGPGPGPILPVDFGTGWYLRGDAAYADDSVPPLSPDLSQFLSSARRATANLDLGFGYKINNWFRADMVVDWWKPIVESGAGASQTCTTQLTTINNFPVITAQDSCTPIYNSSIQRFDLLGNLYADLGTWYGLTPYIGGGAGLSLMHESSNVNWFMSNGLPYHVTTDGFFLDMDRSESSTRYQFAWALMAGASYAITPQLLLDLGYRYINLGRLPSIADPSGNVFWKTMDAHELRLGVRYLID